MDFFQIYKEYASEITDAPMIFHDFVSLAVLSATIGNKIFFRFGHQRILLNLWIVLLAPSSLYRKTTAINIGKYILREIDENIILPDEFSHEKILEVLQVQQQGIFVFSEFLILSSLLAKDYNAGLKSTLTSLYDSPPKYMRRTIHKTYEIDNPCISILSATTIEWLLEKTKEGDLMGGFLPRFIFVPALSKEKTIIFPSCGDINKKENITSFLSDITYMKGGMSFDNEAMKLYKEWYVKFENKVNTQDNYFSSFSTKLALYLLKFACLFAIGEDQRLIVQKKHINKAIQISNFLLSSLENIIQKEFTFTYFQRNLKRVKEIISKNKKISRKELVRKTRLPARILNEIINTLNEGEEIDIVRERGKYKPTIYYISI